LLTRKGRAAASAFLVEGPHAVDAALTAAGHDVRELFVTEAAAERDAGLIDRARAAGAEIRVVTDRVLGSLRDTVTPQGIVAVVAEPVTTLSSALAGAPRLVALLENVGDPGNAGTVIRTADAAGADAVIATRGSVDLWSGKCLRATAGSAFHLPVISDAAVGEVVDATRVAGLQVLVTAADGDTDLDDLIGAGDLSAPTMWVFGNEARGVSPELRTLADRVVRLPIYGAAESLNLAATAAICLYASARAQRR
jgi:TrmH family RNA methyltransferase